MSIKEMNGNRYTERELHALGFRLISVNKKYAKWRDKKDDIITTYERDGLEQEYEVLE